MEKLLFKPYDKEHMKMAMLEHEATFKQQVYELHRLYRIQKIMMRNMGENKRKMEQAMRTVDQGFTNKINGCDDRNTGVANLEVIDESEIELTLGPTRYRRKLPETGSDSGHSLSSSSTGSSQMNRTSRSNDNNNKNRNSFETTKRLGETASFNGSVEEEMRVKQPPWLFQVLSLNIT